MPVSSLVAVTVAPWTAAPVGSVTRPERTADTCALNEIAEKHMKERERAAPQKRNLFDTKGFLIFENGKSGLLTAIPCSFRVPLRDRHSGVLRALFPWTSRAPPRSHSSFRVDLTESNRQCQT